MAVLIRRLEEEDEVWSFDCGDGPLNNYLRKHAWANQQMNSIGVSYVAVEESAPRAVLGYFTLATASVPRSALPENLARGLPRYDVPVILLARLGVDRRFSGRGLGTALLSEAFRITLRVAEQAGCHAMITDAYSSAVEWYGRYGFIALDPAPAGRPQRMFLDLRTLRASLKGPPE